MMSIVYDDILFGVNLFFHAFNNFCFICIYADGRISIESLGIKTNFNITIFASISTLWILWGNNDGQKAEFNFAIDRFIIFETISPGGLMEDGITSWVTMIMLLSMYFRIESCPKKKAQTVKRNMLIAILKTNLVFILKRFICFVKQK